MKTFDKSMYGIIKTIKNIYNKFVFAKIDFTSLVNSIVLFVLAWLSVFWIFQFFTILPAFSLGANMIIHNSFIDFNTVNTASADKQIWGDADNIVNIFGTPAVMLSIVIIFALVLLIKWNSDRINIKRFLFWIIICGNIRLAGNYMAGSLFGNTFNIWQWNLVTDFLGLTTSAFMKYTFVIIALVMLYVFFRIMSNQIKLLFNPYSSNRINYLLSSVFLPMLFGCLFIIIYNLPQESFCEIICIILTITYTSFVLCGYFVFKYHNIPLQTQQKQEKERINKIPICILISFIVLKIFIDMVKGGIIISPSLYKRFLIENTVLFILFIILFTVGVALIVVFRKRKRQQQRIFLKTYRENREFFDRRWNEEDLNNIGTDAPKNMDKYLKNWVDSLYGREENEISDMEDAKNNIDLERYKTLWEEQK